MFNIARRVKAIPALKARLEMADSVYHFLMESPETKRVRDAYRKTTREAVKRHLAMRRAKKKRQARPQNNPPPPTIHTPQNPP